MTSPLLSVRGVKSYYGHIAALRGVDVDVGEGEIVALIGANGAGKSTLMRTIFGNPRAREGHIIFAGRDITQLPTHEIARLKIAQAPEGRRIFLRMSVLENLQMGAAVADSAHFQADVERVFALFPRLKERIDQRGRRAADAGDRTRADGASAPSAPRRTFAGLGAAGRAPDLRCDQEIEQRGKAHRISGGAERLPCLEARASRLCHGQRADRA
jgi:branched-chain amino acid transport system ATP-binding protein